MNIEEYISETSSEDGSVTMAAEVSCNANDSGNLSRLITEEDLIDSLFFTCDVGQTGKVPVSRIIEYLQFTTGNDTEVRLRFVCLNLF